MLKNGTREDKPIWRQKRGRTSRGEFTDQCHYVSHGNQMERNSMRFVPKKRKYKSLRDICVMMFYCHLCGITSRRCVWTLEGPRVRSYRRRGGRGWGGQTASNKAAEWIQDETARSHSVTSLIPPPLHLSKQRRRGHQDCWVIEPARAALSSTSAKNTSPTVTGHQAGRGAGANDCSRCRSAGHSHHR